MQGHRQPDTRKAGFIAVSTHVPQGKHQANGQAVPPDLFEAPLDERKLLTP
jgi:hypothetical protein